MRVDLRRSLIISRIALLAVILLLLRALSIFTVLREGGNIGAFAGVKARSFDYIVLRRFRSTRSCAGTEGAFELTYVKLSRGASIDYLDCSKPSFRLI